MKLELGEWYLNDAARRMALESPELVRRLGVTMLNIAVRLTPPNRGAHSVMGAAARRAGGFGKTNVKALQRRIVSEMIGGEGSKIVLPTAIPTAKGYPVKWQGPQFSWGGYGFRVPRNAGKRKVDFVNVEQVLAGRKFRRRGEVVRAIAGSPPERHVRWARAGDLRAAIQKRLDAAGSLIGGWYPAAQGLGLGGNRANYHPGKKARSGYINAFITEDRFGVDLEMAADWGGLIVGRRFGPHFSRYLDWASDAAIINTENWFLKQVFG